ncbi:DsrE family protein [Mycoplasmatota bacterium WC30]
MDKLNILWTNSDPITSEFMVFMYAINAKKYNWWDEITIIVWGSTAKLVTTNDKIQELVKEAQNMGIKITACKACADKLNISENLDSLGIELKYWGVGLTEILKEDGNLITL